MRVLLFSLLQGEGKFVDLNQTTAVLAPETNTKGGLSLPNKDRVIFRPTERKSILGLHLVIQDQFFLSRLLFFPSFATNRFGYWYFVLTILCNKSEQV